MHRWGWYRQGARVLEHGMLSSLAQISPRRLANARTPSDSARRRIRLSRGNLHRPVEFQSLFKISLFFFYREIKWRMNRRVCHQEFCACIWKNRATCAAHSTWSSTSWTTKVIGIFWKSHNTPSQQTHKVIFRAFSHRHAHTFINK